MCAAGMLSGASGKEGHIRRGGSPCPPCTLTTQIVVSEQGGHGDPPLPDELLWHSLASCSI